MYAHLKFKTARESAGLIMSSVLWNWRISGIRALFRQASLKVYTRRAEPKHVMPPQLQEQPQQQQHQQQQPHQQHWPEPRVVHPPKTTAPRIVHPRIRPQQPTCPPPPHLMRSPPSPPAKGMPLTIPMRMMSVNNDGGLDDIIPPWRRTEDSCLC